MPACPALFVSAPASGQGKTSVTAGLARLHRRLGRRVRVFKTGPDFLDPMLLERASGAPVHALDLGMVGEAGCRALLADAARDADLILIEGVMGLFDGAVEGGGQCRRASSRSPWGRLSELTANYFARQRSSPGMKGSARSRAQRGLRTGPSCRHCEIHGG